MAGRHVDPEDPESKLAIGYLPETTPLYPRMRVAEYLEFVGRMRALDRRARRSALERVLTDCGLEGWERRRIGTLSKGYRQRVGLAQALLGDPRVLVLDEPTGGLDPGEITRIRALIQRLGETKTILLSTHVLAEVQETCRRVIILAAGRVVADGSTLDLAETEEIELHVTLEEASVQPELASLRLAELSQVQRVRPLGRADGRFALALVVNERWSAAGEVSRLVHQQGWPLVELRHDLPSLERVFLSRTEARATRALGAQRAPVDEAPA